MTVEPDACHAGGAPADGGAPVDGAAAGGSDRRVGPVTWLLLTFVRAYQLVVSPWLGPRCRYYPTCSAFAVGALRRHGPVKGLLLAVWRVLRCNPWSRGGVDHVPERGRWVGRREPLTDADAGEQTHPHVDTAVTEPEPSGNSRASTLGGTDRGAGTCPPKDHEEQPG